MTTIPHPVKPIERKPLIPAACWDKSIPTYDGLSLIECDGLVELLLPMLYGGPGRDYRKTYDHIHTCPRCQSAAARFRAPSAELGERLAQNPFMLEERTER